MQQAVLPAAPVARVRRAKLLRPRSGADALARPRLLARLADGLGRPLILVCGPAGYGKSTLLSQWLEAAPAAFAWLSLDAGDDLATFVTGLVAALETVAPGLGRFTVGLFEMPQPPSAETLAAELSDELVDLSEDVILVLDDYHEVADQEVHRFVSSLLRFPSPRLTLVIGARIDPPLPLTRLRAHGQLVEIRAADLRFTDEETAAFLRSTLPPSSEPGTAALIQAHTEGWIAGIRLSTLTLRDRPDPGGLARSFAAGAGRQIMEFLADDVFAAQLAEVQRYLLRTAVPERLSAPLCDALLDGTPETGSSQAMLEHLERAGLFLVRLGDGQWFRYHHLFRDLLLRKLEMQVGANEVRRLHHRASAWFAAVGSIEDAVRHALAAGDATGAADLVERQAHRALAEDRWPELERWLGLLPADLVETRADLLMAHAWVHQVRGHFSAMLAVLKRAAAVLARDGESGPYPDQATLQAEIDLLRLFPTVLEDHLDQSIRAATKVLSLNGGQERFASVASIYFLGSALYFAGDGDGARARLREIIATNSGGTDPISRQRVLWAHFGLGIVEHHVGDLSSCRQLAERMLALASAQGYGRSATFARHLLGRACYERNQLDEAILHFSTIVGERQSGVVVLVDSMLALALALDAAGRVDAANATLDRLRDLIQKTDSAAYLPTLDAFDARLALRRGDLDAATSWLQRSAVSLHDATFQAFEVPAITRAKVLIAEGSPASLTTAARELDEIERRTEAARVMPRWIEALALRALLARARGEAAESRSALARAVDLAAPGGFVRTFVDLGPAMHVLLQDLARTGGASTYVEILLAAFRPSSDGKPRRPAAPATAHAGVGSPQGTMPARALPEPLSERELEVLDGLRRRLSNKEIAEELAISPLTVKRHATNIYGKLGVSGRREAIRRWAEPDGPRSG